MSSHRGYFQATGGSLFSNWISLTAGNYYYIEVGHVQNISNDHITVSLELDGNQIPNHHQSMRAIQHFQINPTNVRETSQIVIQNPDGGTIYIQIVNPTDPSKVWSSDPFSTTASAADVQTAIESYWQLFYSSQIIVTVDTSDPTQTTYTITVNRAQPVATFNQARVQMGTAGSGVNGWVVPPSSQQLSSAPLSGYFAMQCVNPLGQLVTTTDIQAQGNPWDILNPIYASCPQLKDLLEFWDGGKYPTYYDGRDFYLRFVGYNGSPQQLQIVDSQSQPLDGAQPITLSSSTYMSYSSHLVYEPIPYEMLYTNHTQPQVHVTINGQEAVCKSLACDYQYQTFPDVITSFSLSGSSLHIQGASINTTGLSVMYANQNCNVVSAQPSQIICNLQSTTAGTWAPVITNANGLVPVQGAANQVIPVSVASVNPSKGLNTMGGVLLTISGSNFPSSLSEGSTMSITLSDGSTCNVLSTSSTMLTCLTTRFTGSGTSSTLTLNVNGQTDSTHSVTFASSQLTVTSFTPSQLSPVLSANITIYYNPQFLGTLSATDLNATLIQTTNSSNINLLNIFAVDNTAKTVTLKYNGAPPGTYKLVIQSATLGFFNTLSVSIQIIGTITSFSPNSGSIYGGTLITINGYVFSNTYTDNPVQVGSTPCDVITTTPTQITCRLEAQSPGDDTTEDLIVFLRTFEEATCASGVGQCQFTWLSPSTTPNFPSLSYYYAQFIGSVNQYVLTLVGSFGSISQSGVTLYIDGVLQTVTSASSNQITAQISGMLNTTTNNIQFYLPIGSPLNANILTQTGITLNPQIVSVTPSVGSPAGSIITATVLGVGVNTTGVNLVTQSGTSICASITILSYGVVQCLTKASTVSPTTISVTYNGATFQCPQTVNCAYQTSATFPTVTSVAISGSTNIIFTGTNLSTSVYISTNASFGGVQADSVVVNSATQVTATWNLGVPLVAAPLSPTLWFVGNATTGSHWASIMITLNNSLTVKSIDSDVSCSFAGGCTISITQAGLASTLTNSNVQITMCSNPGTILTQLSSATQAVISLPPLQTVYSMTNYNISLPTNIQGALFSSNSNPLITGAPWDGNTVNGFNSISSPCFFGSSFTSGYVGEVTQVKFWMNPFNLNDLVGNLFFQGSNDNITWSNLISVGFEVHEGWNYYNFQTDPLQYNIYRFYSAGPSDSCNIGEVQLLGAVVINDNNSKYICTTQITIGNTTYNLSGAITYTASSTAFLTSISPRFGQVEGGDLVTFSGTGFSSNKNQYVITLDGVNCTVTSASKYSVTCKTGSRPGLIPTSTVILITGQGYIALNGLFFRYVNYWSNKQTWGGSGLPMQGDSVVIPVGLNLLVDVSPPILNAIDVEGSLIFAPNPTNSTTLRPLMQAISWSKAAILKQVQRRFHTHLNQFLLFMDQRLIHNCQILETKQSLATNARLIYMESQETQHGQSY